MKSGEGNALTPATGQNVLGSYKVVIIATNKPRKMVIPTSNHHTN